MDWEHLLNSIKLPKAQRERYLRQGMRALLVLAAAYVTASTVSAWMMSEMLGSTLQAFNRMGARQSASASINLAVTENYRDIRKAIMDRNLFNAGGEFPDETNPAARQQETQTSNFDMKAPCIKVTLPLELVGTIYLSDGNSVVTVQEKGYSEADVYREGDEIIGNQQASIVKIERNHVVLNNNGVKECLELASAEKKGREDGFPEAPTGSDGGGGSGEMPSPSGEGQTKDCNLDEKYVQDELGPGFGTIIQKARLVPNTADNNMNGFKIFAIDKSSLLGRVGLDNGDIITQVNETSLKQPEQGFTLYQAFQDEREVRIHILRKGVTPMTITCRIR